MTNAPPSLPILSATRAGERGVLAPSTGVPGANGGLLGRQMAARRGASGVLPGPGAFALPKGDGPIGARALPRSGLPRQRPFLSAHLKALGSLSPDSLPSSAAASADDREHGGGMAAPTAHVVSYVNK